VARRVHKGRGYYGRSRRSRFYSGPRRVVARELRYFTRKMLTIGIVLAFIMGAGFFSDQFGSIRWSQFVPKLPSTPPASAQDIIGRASVIDGDTLDIHGQRIRLWGIDAPESAQPCHIAGKPWRCGQQAALALSDHIGQQTVACLERDRDRYGRVVAKCSVAAEDIGAWLVSNGWALDWAQYSGGGYSSHQANAKSAKAGIWRGGFDKPWEWRRSRR
jgi:endonuclease YncB( thermonuclease family)